MFFLAIQNDTAPLTPNCIYDKVTATVIAFSEFVKFYGVIRVMEETYFVELSTRSNHVVWIETVLFSVINLTAFFRSLLAFFAVYTNQRLRTLTNMFVVALVVNDILISICCMPFTISTLIRGRWIFREIVCRFQGLAMFTFVLASLHTMGIIAISRYFRVVRPQKFIVLFTKQRIFMYIAAV